ncbi:hypothetical protein BDQ12DRAFT_64408 [Crucibulum laeve]|uniref:Uncharacterized protein n=1 Tax=Crucibulum laeve TaxID=68775 RepID=A0A5C3LGX1_9AGAR|nr:hypothetical protein BDQ12DRAFT_64408 [Crucibulum laeve]
MTREGQEANRGIYVLQLVSSGISMGLEVGSLVTMLYFLDEKKMINSKIARFSYSLDSIKMSYTFYTELRDRIYAFVVERLEETRRAPPMALGFAPYKVRSRVFRVDIKKVWK